jgi:hypothetical protein
MADTDLALGDWHRYNLLRVRRRVTWPNSVLVAKIGARVGPVKAGSGCGARPETQRSETHKANGSKIND